MSAIVKPSGNTTWNGFGMAITVCVVFPFVVISSVE